MIPALRIRRLYYDVVLHQGPDVFATVIEPWLDEHGGTVRDALAPLAEFGGWARTEYEFGDLLETAYAASRVSDVLIYRFQPPAPPGADQSWAQEIHQPEQWPEVSRDEYLAVFTQLGMTPIEECEFEPFYHEVVHVEQDELPEAPVTITGTVWPGLMLGQLLFGRAGVRVRAGASHLVAGIADESPLHEVFIRRDRHTLDASLGWGSNSQWKTDFRRDYATGGAFCFNVDEKPDSELDLLGRPRLLTPQERVDLVRFRCLTRPLTDPAAEPSASAGGRITVSRGAPQDPG